MNVSSCLSDFMGHIQTISVVPAEQQLNGGRKNPAPKEPCGTGNLCAGQQPLNSNNNCSTPTPGISLKGYPIIKQHKFPKRYFYLLVLLIKNFFSKGNHCKLSWEKLPTLPRYFVCCLSPFFRNPHIISSLKTSISFCLPHWKFLILN